MKNWEDVLPHDIAKKQMMWERTQSMRRMLALGFTMADVARKFGLTRSRVHAILNYEKERHKSPIESWFCGRLVDLRALKRMPQWVSLVD